MFAKKNGIVQRTKLSEFENIRNSSKICINLNDNDELLDVKKINGNNIILLGSDKGQMVKFDENEVRVMGRTTTRVKGIKLDDTSCIFCEVVNSNSIILLVTEKD